MSASAQEPPLTSAPSEQSRHLSLKNSSNHDHEVLDLGPRQGEALTRQDACPAKLPSGAVVGTIGAKPVGCDERTWAKSQYPIASELAKILWCKDPGGAKAASRESALRRLAEHKSLTDARDHSRKPEQAKPSRPESARPWLLAPLDALAELLAPNTSALPHEPRPRTHATSYYDASRDSALSWDAKESTLCRQAPELPPELGPSLSVSLPGKILLDGASCDAFLIESTLLSGRHLRSRITWIASKCSGYPQASPADMALAISSGEASAQNWQKKHLAAWKWQGPPPREAQARSADLQ